MRGLAEWRVVRRCLLALTFCTLFFACGGDGSDAPATADATISTDGTPPAPEDSGLVVDAEVPPMDAEVPPMDTEVPPIDAEVPPDEETVWTWLEARHAEVKASPDNLPERAQEAVATGDPEAIFNFVRDHFAVIPTTRNDNSWAEIWYGGPRAALRSGVGTPQEIVDLLVQLYTQAGFSAKAVHGQWMPEEASDAWAFWLRPRPTLPFEPGISEAELSTLRADSPFGATPQLDGFAGHGERAAQIAETLLTNAEDWMVSPEPFDPSFYYALPMVEVEVNGQTLYANPFHPDAVFGESYSEWDSFDEIDDHRERVEVELQLVGHLASGRLVELTSASFFLDELVGRPVMVGLSSVLPVEQAVQTPYEQQAAAVGQIVVTRDAQTPEAMKTIFMGAPVSFGGEVFVEGEDGGFVFEDGGYVAPAPGVDASQVTQLSARAEASFFPQVRLGVQATDAQDRFVAGLGADAFEVTDGGQPVPWALRRNTNAPRIRLLYDTSGSMPWWIYNNAEGVAEAMAERIYQRYPDALLTLVPTESNLWTSVTAAMAEQPDAILYLSDGDKDDEYDPRMDALLAQGPAPIILAVGYAIDHLDAFDDLIEHAQAKVVYIEDEAELLEAIDAELPELEGGGYVLSWQAPADASGTREVTIQTPQGVAATAQYTVPEADQRMIADAFVGLSLKTAVGGVVSGAYGTYPLVGYTLDEALEEGAQISEYVAQVRQSLGDRNVLYFEGDALLPGVLLDEHIAGLRSTRALFEHEDWSEEGLSALLEQYVYQRPLELYGAFRPFEALEEGYIFASRGRIALLRDLRRPVQDGAGAREVRTIRQINLLPMQSLSALVRGDAMQRAQTLAQASIKLALDEAQMYTRATANLLDDAHLVSHEDAQSIPDWSFKAPDSLETRTFVDVALYSSIPGWTEIFVDAQSREPAAWVIAQETGEVYAMLSDGSGGGESEVQELRAIAAHLHRVNYTSTMISIGNKIAGGQFGAVNAYGKLLANLYGAASILVATISAAYQEEDAQKNVLAAACEATKHLRIDPADLGGKALRAWVADSLGDIWGGRCP